MYDSTTDKAVTARFQDTTVELSAETLDHFIEEMEGLEVQTRRVRNTGPFGKSFSRASSNARDGRGREKIELVLYTSAASEKCQRAIRAVHAILSEYDRSQVKFTVLDLSTPDGTAEAPLDGVIFTPTLVKRAPGPRTWIVGNLEHPDLLIDLLEVSGVDRLKE